MNKRRICTTISQKHWEILKRHVDKFETQQKALEFALESLDNGSKQSPALTREEKWEERYWICLKSTKLACFIQKDGLKILLETGNINLLNEHVAKYKPMEYNIKYYLQKPLKELSLKEVVDGQSSLPRCQTGLIL